MSSIDQVYSRAVECLGESLRVAASYDDESTEFAYLRDDVSTQYTDDEIDDIREFFLFEGMHEPYLETQFKRSLRCRLFAFEDSIVLHFRRDDASGYFIGIDPEGAGGIAAFLDDQPEHPSSDRTTVGQEC